MMTILAISGTSKNLKTIYFREFWFIAIIEFPIVIDTKLIPINYKECN